MTKKPKAKAKPKRDDSFEAVAKRLGADEDKAQMRAICFLLAALLVTVASLADARTVIATSSQALERAEKLCPKVRLPRGHAKLNQLGIWDV